MFVEEPCRQQGLPLFVMHSAFLKTRFLKSMSLFCLGGSFTFCLPPHSGPASLRFRSEPRHS